MLKVELRSANGKTYLLTGVQSQSPVLAPEEQLVGLVGQVQRTDVAVPGRPGVLPGRPRFGAIQAEVSFFLHADSGVEMEQVYKTFRQGWSMTAPSHFAVWADRPGGPWLLPVVLDKPLPGVGVDARARTSLTVPVSVFNKTGLFESELKTGTNTVTVTNSGHVDVYPKIRYSGAGGVVTSVSGARFTIPAVQAETVVDLDPMRCKLDGAFTEGVPPGANGTWLLPSGAALEWRLLVADPWA